MRQTKVNENKRGCGRTRNWTCIIYPVEGNPSAPENWRSIIDDEHIQWVESPLHDKDINPDGSLKRAHIHLLFLYESVKTFDQVKELTDKLNAPIPQKCNGAKGLVRYMAHLDNPEKARYSTSEIVGHGGVDVFELLKPSSTERYRLIGEMMDFVQEQNIYEIEDLLMYARRNRFDDWFPLLCDSSVYVMSVMIKSRRYRKGEEYKSLSKIIRVDRNGEVVE